MKKNIFLLILCTIFASATTWALELPSIDKPKVRVAVAPGEATYGEITLENHSSQARSVRCYLEDWRYTPGGDGAKDFFPPNTTALSCASWISFSPAELTIPAYGKRSVNYSIKVPPEAKSGGHYAILFFESSFQPESSATDEVRMGAGIGLNVRIGTLFYVEVKGQINRQVSLENLNLTQKQDQGLSIQLELVNTGNVDITAATSYHIINNEGIVVARGKFNDAYTFPEEKVKLTARWNKALASGSYTLVITSDIGKALEETNSGRGPVLVKEATIQVNKAGEIISVGNLH